MILCITYVPFREFRPRKEKIRDKFNEKVVRRRFIMAAHGIEDAN